MEARRGLGNKPVFSLFSCCGISPSALEFHQILLSRTKAAGYHHRVLEFHQTAFQAAQQRIFERTTQGKTAGIVVARFAGHLPEEHKPEVECGHQVRVAGVGFGNHPTRRNPSPCGTTRTREKTSHPSGPSRSVHTDR